MTPMTFAFVAAGTIAVVAETAAVAVDFAVVTGALASAYQPVVVGL